MEYLDERDINIYTDGSMLPAPRRGGLGIVFVTEGPDGNWQADPFPVPGYAGATNNQMERRACIEALQALNRGYAPIGVDGYRRVVVWTDSMLLVDGFRYAQTNWPASGWVTQDGNPVVDAEEWRQLLKVAHRLPLPVIVEWVKGHKHSSYNKQADKLAKASARGQLRPPLVTNKVRRKKSPYSFERGSVQMRGQLLRIRILEERPPSGGLVRFKYEVMTKSSAYFQRIDFIWDSAGSTMRAGHTYKVRVNDNDRAPRIVKLLGEVT